ncbi:MAG: hypothetical protein GY898_00670 [Proteobacteria bacterium]|nr:hypothetical protein [Pseudomonadota bacterium]
MQRANWKKLLGIVLVTGALAGCGSDGTLLQTWWGPLDADGGGTPFSAGGRFEVHAFGSRVLTETTPSRDLIGISLVSAAEPVSCSGYASYLDVMADTEEYVADILALPRAEQPAQWIQYVCQTIEGASTEAFGADGSYRALSALLDVSDGGPSSGVFRAAPPGAEPAEFAGAELLVPSTYVSRLHERSRHGEGILPAGGDGIWLTDDLDPVSGCARALATLIEEFETGRETYPDHAAIAMAASSHRYYHHYTSQEEIELEAGNGLQVAWTVPDWDSIASTGADLNVTQFGGVARAHADFPYQQMLVSSQGRTVPIEPCADLNPSLPILWPEVDELGFAAPPMGDDDDSAL